METNQMQILIDAHTDAYSQKANDSNGEHAWNGKLHDELEIQVHTL